MEGYCTTDDVRQAMQEAELSGPIDTPIVEAAIAAQTDWLRRETGNHWYDPSAASELIPSSPYTITDDNHNIPSSPHAKPHQLPNDDFTRHPLTQGGGYARIRLDWRHVDTINKLLVRSGREYEDWVQDSSREQGRGKDYYLESVPERGMTDLYVLARDMTPRQDWTNAVVTDYEFGVEGIPDSIRRAQACLAGADLVMDDDVKTAIPDDGQLVAVESKADRLIKQANRLLDQYR